MDNGPVQEDCGICAVLCGELDERKATRMTCVSCNATVGDFTTDLENFHQLCGRDLRVDTTNVDGSSDLFGLFDGVVSDFCDRGFLEEPLSLFRDRIVGGFLDRDFSALYLTVIQFERDINLRRPRKLGKEEHSIL